MQFAVHRRTERRSCARQPRHHGANGDPHVVSQLPVGQTLELAQHEQLMRTIRQRAHRPRDQRGVIGLQQQCLRIGRRYDAVVLLLIERIGERPDSVAGASKRTLICATSSRRFQSR